MFKDILKDQLLGPEQVISPEMRHLVHRGEALHYLLAEIDAGSFLEDPASYAQGINYACGLFNYSDPEGITRCLIEFLRHPKINKFFNPQYRALNEKEVVDQCGNLRRIDRLVFIPLEAKPLTGFTEDKILIIDYKAGEEHKEEHRGQIKEYLRLIGEIYPDRLCEGWLLYVDTREAVLVKG